MKKLLENYKKTTAYKINGYIALVSLLFVLFGLFLAYICNVGAGMIFSILIIFILLFFLCVIIMPVCIILSIISLIQSFKHKKDTKTCVVANIGNGIYFLFLLCVILLPCFESNEKKIMYDMRAYAGKITNFMSYHYKDYNKGSEDIAEKFAKYCKDKINVESVVGNRVTTKDKILVFNIEGNCENDCNVQVYYKSPKKFYYEKKVKSYKTAQGDRYFSLESGMVKAISESDNKVNK
ncbi:hypothetical protein IJO12_05200 [bacterium]|nr:hypothetical protein [bacterium]